MNVGVVSISGFNVRALITYCRFAEAAGFTIHLWARDSADPVFLTAYARWVHGIRSSAGLAIKDLLKFVDDVRQEFGYERILLLPISEYFNRLILGHRTVLESHGVIVPLVPESLYHQISNKYSFGALCSNHGLAVPNEVQPVQRNIPFVAKPKTYNRLHGSVAPKPYIVLSDDDLENFEDISRTGDFYFQEFIAGPSYYLLLFLSKDGQCCRLSQRNFVQQYNGRSIIAARKSTLHSEKICDSYIEMLKSVRFYGLIMIELKYFNSSYYMIEANPRIWGPSQLVLDSGGEIIERFFRDNGVSFPAVGFERHFPRHDYYYWSGGLVEDALNKSPVSFHEYDSAQFLAAYNDYSQSDVFLRADTIDLYLKQAQGSF